MALTYGGRVTSATRDLDLVRWGASGFTGRLVAEHLAARAPATRRWAASSWNARVRLRQENDRLTQDLALLREEMRIKDPRMLQIHSSTPTALSPDRAADSIKNECTRRLLVPYRHGDMRRELALYVDWHNAHRRRFQPRFSRSSSVVGYTSKRRHGILEEKRLSV